MVVAGRPDTRAVRIGRFDENDFGECSVGSVAKIIGQLTEAAKIVSEKPGNPSRHQGEKRNALVVSAPIHPMVVKPIVDEILIPNTSTLASISV